jgi:hypothetical protein
MLLLVCVALAIDPFFFSFLCAVDSKWIS